MPALESRYDHESSASPSDDEDFVNASPARTPSRPSSAAAASASRRSVTAHSSSSSESTDSEEEQALREELANAGGDLEAGVVRGAPVEGRVERIMRSIGKELNSGAAAGSRYQAVNRDRGRKHSTEHARSSSRTSGRMLALGKDDPSEPVPAQDPYVIAEKGAVPAKRSRSGRSSKKDSTGEATTKSTKSKKKSLLAGGAPGGPDSGPASSKPRRRIWCYLFVALILIVVIAIGVYVAVKVVKDKKDATQTDSESAAASDISQSDDVASSADDSSTAAISDATSTSGTSVSDATLDFTSASAADSSSTSESTSATVSYDDGLYHSVTTDSMSDSQATSTAAAPISTSISQLGQWGSMDPSASQTTNGTPNGESSDLTQTPTLSETTDNLATSSYDLGGSSGATPLPTSTTGAGDFAQTTVASSASSSQFGPLPVSETDGSAGSYSEQQGLQSTVSAVADPASASFHFGPGPVIMSTSPMSSTTTAAATDAFAGSSDSLGAAIPQASVVGQYSVASTTAESAPTPSATEPSVVWMGSPSSTPSADVAQGENSWNDPSEVEAVGPFAVASVYQATAPESFQTLHGNGTYFVINQHYGACGVAPNSSDYVVALSHAMWLNSTTGSSTASSTYCGAEVLVTNAANGMSINAWVTEHCALCAGDSSLDLSVPVFSALSNGNLDVGVLDIIWGFTGNSSAASATSQNSTASADQAVTSASSTTSAIASESVSTSATSSDDGWLWRRRASSTPVLA